MIETAQNGKQGGFPRARLPHDGDKLAVINVKIHLLDGLHGVFPVLVILADILDFNEMLYIWFNSGILHGFDLYSCRMIQ
jgi:hypothetical protein